MCEHSPLFVYSLILVQQPSCRTADCNHQNGTDLILSRTDKGYQDNIQIVGPLHGADFLDQCL